MPATTDRFGTQLKADEKGHVRVVSDRTILAYESLRPWREIRRREFEERLEGLSNDFETAGAKPYQQQLK